MTVDEAKNWLGCTGDLEELEEIYTEKLFELQKYFLNWVPFTKLLDSKSRNSEKLIEAFIVLGYEVPQPKQFNVRAQLDSIDPKSVWNEFQSSKNTIRSTYLSCSLNDIMNLAKMELDLYRNYASFFPEKEIKDESVKASKEMDPMILQAAFNDFSSTNLDWDRISTLSSDNPLVLEMKRLNLWLKIENGES